MSTLTVIAHLNVTKPASSVGDQSPAQKRNNFLLKTDWVLLQRVRKHACTPKRALSRTRAAPS